VDEEFRLVQCHVKDTIYGMLKTLIKERFVLKGETDINRILDEITNDKVPIEAIYWIKIIERMYDDTDVLILESKIKDSAKTRLHNDI
jgi:hypothetical protein